MSLKALSDYTIYAKYARYLTDKNRRETWEEQINRVFEMHERKFKDILESNDEFKNEFEFAKLQVLKKRVLGSQRSLQFGGHQIEKHNLKMYNCSGTQIDRLEVFNEIFYVLLCGCGVGFSVQKHHIEKLPEMEPVHKNKTFIHIADDSIEGWADCVKLLLASYFAKGEDIYGYNVEFDFKNIRPAGAMISGGFKAPGPEGLSIALEKVRGLLDTKIEEGYKKLRSIDAYDIIMHISDAVLSGGVRRSACITMFSSDDEEMMNAKTGNWFTENPQRGRSNNSVVFVKNEVTREDFNKVFQVVKECGEPGFVLMADGEHVVNPCCEVTMLPKLDNNLTGFGLCNLTEINGKWCSTEEEFHQACRASAIIGTLQASYTDFRYLSDTTKEIVERDALLGCSVTGMMDNPDILFDPGVQRRGARLIKQTNAKIAKIIGINPAQRTCVVKPAGTTSCVLGTSSGIHPHHSRRYFRRVQANNLEFPLQYFAEKNPIAVEHSVWSNNNTDSVITFLCEVPHGSIVKNQISAIEMLERVKSTQQNWVRYGTLDINSNVTHNVSNTITVHPDEWKDVERYIYNNRAYFTGVSLLPASGDKDYPQAPFTNVLNSKEIEREYGAGSVFASGLIVDGLKAFNDNLWAACDSALGFGEDLSEDVPEPKEPTRPKKNGYTDKEYNRRLNRYATALTKYYLELEQYDEWYYKKEWIRRAHGFADKYFDGNVKRMTYCLKDVNNWKMWCDLSREYKQVDWSKAEESAYYESVDTMGAQACAGGKCEINF